MAELEAQGLTLAYGQRAVIEGLNVSIQPGKITSIVGANGCGKSTLLRGLSRLLTPSAGKVVLDGADISTIPARKLAQKLGLLPQSPNAPEAMTVAELVSLGRHPHRALLGGWSAADDAAITEALELTGVAEFAQRRVDELSGGQRQRVWIATVLAQNTDTLLLDEPISFLDIARCIEVLDVVSELNQVRGTTVVMVLHDLNLAARYSDQLIAVRDGAVLAQGNPADVVTEQTVEETFGVGCRVIEDPVSGTPLVVPVSARRSLRHSS